MRGTLIGLARCSLVIGLACLGYIFWAEGQLPAAYGLNIIAGVYGGLLGWVMFRVWGYCVWNEGEWNKCYSLRDPRHPLNRHALFPVVVW